MEISVKWQQGLRFTGTSRFGHEISIDASREAGGNQDGYQPVELLMFALAGCTGMDVINIGRKMRLDITGLKINVNYDQKEDPPKVIAKAHLDYAITGRDLDPQKIERAIQLSEEKYCSVGATLAGVTKITHSYTITEG